MADILGKQYFQMHIVNENYLILILISLKFLPKDSVDDKTTLF